MANFLLDEIDFANNEIVITGINQFDYLLKNNIANSGKIIFNVDENSSLNLNIIDFTSSDMDVNVVVNLAFNSQCRLQVASICSKDNKKRFKIDVNHLAKNTYSRTKMAGINSGNGNLKFLGNSLIKNGASKSDTRQEGKITNLSPECKSEVSPALLIDENDVNASHGAALGAYNPEIIYYLMSRGLSLEESKKIITYGNLLPIIESLDNKDIVEECKNILGGISL